MKTVTKPKSKETKKSKASSTKSSKSKTFKEKAQKNIDIVASKKNVKVEVETFKKDEEKITKSLIKKGKIVEVYSADLLLEGEFGALGTTIRSECQDFIKESFEKLILDVKEKIRLKNEPKPKIEEKKVTEPISENAVLPKGIIPADFVPENKNADNKENLPSRPIQLYREYIVHQGAEFLNGELKVQENDTKIARTKDTEYMIYKNIGSTNAFTTPFKCHDLAEAELFLDELNAYENKIKNTKMENEPKQEMPIQETSKQEVISEEQKKEIINKYEGLPLQEVDIKELIKAAGDAPTSNNTIANQIAQNNSSNAQTLSQMESYADTLAGLINDKPWMKKSTVDINRLIANQVSKLYNYLLKNDGNGYYIEISQGNVKTRCPRDINSFLNIA